MKEAEQERCRIELLLRQLSQHLDQLFVEGDQVLREAHRGQNGGAVNKREFQLLREVLLDFSQLDLIVGLDGLRLVDHEIHDSEELHLTDHVAGGAILLEPSVYLVFVLVFELLQVILVRFVHVGDFDLQLGAVFDNLRAGPEFVDCVLRHGQGLRLQDFRYDCFDVPIQLLRLVRLF